MRPVESLACLIVCLAATPAAAQTGSFNIPAGRLSDALIALGQQAGLTIGASEPGLAMVRSRAVRGRMPAQTALSRLLAGTGYGFTFVGPRTVRITRAAPRPPRRTPPPPAPPPPNLQLPKDSDVEFLYPGAAPARQPHVPAPDDVYYYVPSKGYYRMSPDGARVQQLLDAMSGAKPGSIINIR